MAVVVKRCNEEGEISKNGVTPKLSFTVPFKVTADLRSEIDACKFDRFSAGNIMGNDFASTTTIPSIHTIYKDRDGQSCAAFVSGVTFSKDYMGADKKWCRDVTVTLESLSQENQDGSGSGTTDPNNFCPDITITEVTHTRAASRLRFLGFSDDGLVTLVPVANDCAIMPTTVIDCKSPLVPLMTTAGEPFEPVELDGRTLDFEFVFARQFPGATIAAQNNAFDAALTAFEPYIGSLNCEPFSLEINCRRYKQTFPRHTAWCTSILPQPATLANGIPYWNIHYRIKYNPAGWFLDVANRGSKQCLFENGVPVGTHGFISPTDPPDGTPRVQNIQDAQGIPVKNVHLNQGGVVSTTGATYLRYLESDRQSNFNEVAMKLVNWATP